MLSRQIVHGASDRCPGCRALVSGGRAQGTEECRIRVEGELRKTEGKARLRAAASRAVEERVDLQLSRRRCRDARGHVSVSTIKSPC